MAYLIIVFLVILAAFKAAWDEYSYDVFAMIFVFFVIGAWAAINMSVMSAKAKKTGKPMDEGGYGCLFWIAWKLGGIAVILLLGAGCSRWF
ncbi:hypothetical protein [Streptomyces sp. NPDC005209]|uniref:hypothetical protein n=1 Tax=Streptomyces sp. NPDC005209 TaxID=3156715 RepID=UPI0033A3E90D